MTVVKLLVLHSSTWNHLTVYKKMSSGSFKNVIYKMCLQFIYLIYMYKQYLALNNFQGLICHKTKLNKFPYIYIYIYIYEYSLVQLNRSWE